MKSIRIAEHIQIHWIATQKFKDSAISLRFLLDLDEKKANARSLLAFILPTRSANYPTSQQLTTRLDELYGMYLGFQTYGMGACHMLELKCNVLADRYAIKKDGSMLQEAWNMIKEILFEPLMHDGQFDQELVDEAKMIMKSRIMRRQDDPSGYALEESSKIVGKGTPYGISCLGEYDAVDAITQEEILCAYNDLLKRSVIQMYVVSDVEEKDMVFPDALKDLMQERHTSYALQYEWPKQLTLQENEVTRDIEQSNLVMTWMSDIHISDPLFYAYKVANSMFGGDANSLLFKVIREQNSLCYSIYSSVYSLDRIMIVSAGIAYENVEKTIMLTKAQLHKLQEGDFDEETVEISKRLLMNGVRAQFDSSSGIVNFSFQQEVTGTHRSLEDIMHAYEVVTKQDVIAALAQMQLIGIFVLKEEAHANNE